MYQRFLVVKSLACLSVKQMRCLRLVSPLLEIENQTPASAAQLSEKARMPQLYIRLLYFNHSYLNIYEVENDIFN